MLWAGCGEDDTESTEISKTAFVRQADQICEKTSAKVNSEGPAALQRIADEGQKSSQETEEALVSEWLVPLIRAEIDELRALGAPSGEEDRIDAILEALEDVIGKAAADPGRYLYEQGNFKYPYREAEKLATAYGIEACGQP